MELYHNYDCSEMSFNPPIPPPKPTIVYKEMKGRHVWNSQLVEQRCEEAKHVQLPAVTGRMLDFAADYRHGVRTAVEAAKLGPAHAATVSSK